MGSGRQRPRITPLPSEDTLKHILTESREHLAESQVAIDRSKTSSATHWKAIQHFPPWTIGVIYKDAACSIELLVTTGDLCMPPTKIIAQDPTIYICKFGKVAIHLDGLGYQLLVDGNMATVNKGQAYYLEPLMDKSELLRVSTQEAKE